MAKKKGKGASPAKNARPQARPLLVSELLALFGGNRSLAAGALDYVDRESKRGRKGYSKLIIESVWKRGGGSVNELGKMNENEATRFLRSIGREVAAERRQVQPAA